MSNDENTMEDTYNFPTVEVILAFSAVSFKTRTHIHACADHGDRLVKPFGDKRVVHLAFGNGFLAFDLASFHELPRRKLAYV